jgi:hypothetical protein
MRAQLVGIVAAGHEAGRVSQAQRLERCSDAAIRHRVDLQHLDRHGGKIEAYSDGDAKGGTGPD